MICQGRWLCGVYMGFVYMYMGVVWMYMGCVHMCMGLCASHVQQCAAVYRNVIAVMEYMHVRTRPPLPQTPPTQHVHVYAPCLVLLGTMSSVNVWST